MADAESPRSHIARQHLRARSEKPGRGHTATRRSSFTSNAQVHQPLILPGEGVGSGETIAEPYPRIDGNCALSADNDQSNLPNSVCQHSHCLCAAAITARMAADGSIAAAGETGTLYKLLVGYPGQAQYSPDHLWYKDWFDGAPLPASRGAPAFLEPCHHPPRAAGSQLCQRRAAAADTLSRPARHPTRHPRHRRGPPPVPAGPVPVQPRRRRGREHQRLRGQPRHRRGAARKARAGGARGEDHVGAREVGARLRGVGGEALLPKPRPHLERMPWREPSRLPRTATPRLPTSLDGPWPRCAPPLCTA